MKALSQKFLKLPLWLWVLLAAGMAGGLLAFALSQPQLGSWRYGACRVFLEHTLRFPVTLQIKDVMESQASSRITYSDINPYGSQQMRDFECYYSTGTDGRTVLSKITLDRKILPDDKITLFNQMLPIILTQELNTALPDTGPSNLEDFRK